MSVCKEPDNIPDLGKFVDWVWELKAERDQLRAELSGLRTGFDAQNEVIADLRKKPAFDREAARLAIRKAIPDYPGDGLDYALFAAIDAAMGKGKQS